MGRAPPPHGSRRRRTHRRGARSWTAYDQQGPPRCNEILPTGDAAPVVSDVDRVINCSGPLSDISQIPAPLIRALLSEGGARADPLHLGLDVTGEGAVIAGDGRISNQLFAVGPITKGVFWETTAVPDIRLQCERLAAHILATAHRGASDKSQRHLVRHGEIQPWPTFI